MTFLGLRPSKAGGWVHDVRWTDSFKAFADQRMMIADLANIDRADHNAMHSPNAPTRHHVQPGFAKEPLHVFPPKYSWQTHRSKLR